jgi:hypothetical protein
VVDETLQSHRGDCQGDREVQAGLSHEDVRIVIGETSFRRKMRP